MYSSSSKNTSSEGSKGSLSLKSMRDLKVTYLSNTSKVYGFYISEAVHTRDSISL